MTRDTEDKTHLARLAEAHEPDLIRAEIEAKVAVWAKPKRLPLYSKVAGVILGSGVILGGVMGTAWGILLLIIKYWGL